MRDGLCQIRHSLGTVVFAIVNETATIAERNPRTNQVPQPAQPRDGRPGTILRLAVSTTCDARGAVAMACLALHASCASARRGGHG